MANENEEKIESKTKKGNWYENKLYVILWLIFFFPVGIYGVWKTGDWSKRTRWILTALPIVLFLWIMVADSMAPPVITVSGYKANQEVEGQEYRVAGQVTPSVSKLKINGVDVQVEADGQFAYNVQLKDGQNEIIISATNAGKTVEFKEIIKKISAEEIAKREAETEKAKAEAEAKIKAEAQAKAEAEARANAPVVLSGVGQQATNKFHLESGLKIFKMTHSGGGNFAIWLLDSNGNKLGLLVNEIGSFNGSKAEQIPFAGDYLLDVMASGSWTVTIGK